MKTLSPEIKKQFRQILENIKEQECSIAYFLDEINNKHLDDWRQKENKACLQSATDKKEYFIQCFCEASGVGYNTKLNQDLALLAAYNYKVNLSEEERVASMMSKSECDELREAYSELAASLLLLIKEEHHQ
ncbi:hypothetical protein [Photobacterium kishitanii]|uniref:Uncharacterized protein n=1 Tax=Photobacterium kishitanii TaxID=318456 RepID=A0A2T3KLB3_9GAMM|nr:hypothetical protein [Photobacterium kishitanii]PSV00508.1 hypothetical protein C9J27_05075 [Photobacterium kishitanii]